MSDYTHLHVLHKSTGKVVSIYQMMYDATWVGKERDEFIALPIDTPEGVDEIKMIFTKGFKRYEGTCKEQRIYSFFKRKSGESETLSEIKKEGESKAHKLAKEQIYIGLLNGDIRLNGKTIKELKAKDLSLEEYSDSGHSIADIFVKFEDHPRYKRGICIEVQFSPQNKERTSERTLSRLREGWCVIWLWEEDFENGKLLKDNFEIKSYEEYLKELKEDEYNSFLNKMNKIGELIDNKLKYSIDKYNNNASFSNEKYYKKIKEIQLELLNKLNRKELFIDNKLEILDKRYEQINELIKKIEVESNEKKEILNKYYNNLVEKSNNCMINFENKINENEIAKQIEKWLDKKVEEYKTKILLVHQNEEIDRRIKELENKREDYKLNEN